MAAELHLVTRCDGCGGYGRIDLPQTEREYLEGSGQTIQCPTCNGAGGSVEVLDPDRVLWPADADRITVQALLDALTDGGPT